MNTYNATVYTNRAHDPRHSLDAVPAQFAVRLDLEYRSGARVVLIYEQAPPDREMQDLMWQLQTAAGSGQFAMFRTAAPGAAREPVPALPPGTRRLG